MSISIRKNRGERGPRLTTLAACLAVSLFAGNAGAIDPAVGSREGRVLGNRALFGHTQSSETHSLGALNRATRDRAHTALLPARPAATLPVLNCNDSGPGSLREVMAGAVSGDVVDMQALTCGTISLTSGTLPYTVDVGLLGPGQNSLTIDGNNNGYVLEGVAVSIEGLTIVNGSSSSGFGGCLSVFGDLSLTNSKVTGCHAGDGSNDYAYGAGVNVRGNLFMNSSTISNSHASAGKQSFGGGAYVGGYAYLVDSTISMSSSTASTEKARGGGVFARETVALLGSGILHNKVVSVDGTAYGGGIASQESVYAFARSSISGNTAHSDTSWSYGAGVQVGDDFGDRPGQAVLVETLVSDNLTTSSCTGCFIQGGGVSAFGPIIAYYSAVTNNHVISASSSSGTALGGGLASYSGNIEGKSVDGTQLVVNSTISGNSAIGGQNGGGYGGGLNANVNPVALVMSTVAFNKASSEGGGAAFGDGSGTYNPQLSSSIVSNNSAPNGADIASTSGYALTIDGSHNIVISAASEVVLPAGTISFDPKLMPLARNGGLTPNHELATCSPAIDAGLNQFGNDPLGWDQRGDPYARSEGAATDIGAFELQINAAADVIFRHSFEVPLCP